MKLYEKPCVRMTYLENKYCITVNHVKSQERKFLHMATDGRSFAGGEHSVHQMHSVVRLARIDSNRGESY